MDEKIVYIIIAIIWIVTSIVKAVGKKAKNSAQQTTPKPKDSNTPSGMEDFKKILEEMIIGKQQEIPSTQTVEEYHDNDNYSSEAVSNSESSKYAAYQGKTEYSFSNYQNLEDIYDFEKAKNEKIFQKDFYNTLKNNDDGIRNDNAGIRFLNEDFDLKKALIYSEILKRPQY